MTTIQAICPVCDVLFDARSMLAVYCSDTCKCRAAYYRRKGRPVPKVKRANPKPIRPQVLQPTIVEATNKLPQRSWDFAPTQESIEQRAWRGTDIQRRSRDGWVNATAMCQAGGKRWNNYERGDRTQEYITALREALAAETRCAAAVAQNRADVSEGSTRFRADPSLPPVIESVTTGLNHLRGTWVHPRLAVDLARWISPAFAVWMDGWFLEATQTTQPTTPMPPGVFVAARSRREAMRLWQTAIEAEIGWAVRSTISATNWSDHALPSRCSTNWQLVLC